MRIFIVFIIIFSFYLSPAFAQEELEIDALTSSDAIAYDDDLKEFQVIGIGLLLEKGQEELLKNIKDNSHIMRAGETSDTQQSDKTGIKEALELYKEKEFDEAFLQLMSIARTGNPMAQETIGLMLLKGQGTEVDEKQAVRWLERAAKRLRPIALHYLGSLYFQGKGVQRDIVEGAMWIQLAILAYPDGSEEQIRAKKDLKNIMLRLSLREQRSTQDRVEDWKEKHASAFKLIKRNKEIKLLSDKKKKEIADKKGSVR